MGLQRSQRNSGESTGGYVGGNPPPWDGKSAESAKNRQRKRIPDSSRYCNSENTPIFASRIPTLFLGFVYRYSSRSPPTWGSNSFQVEGRGVEISPGYRLQDHTPSPGDAQPKLLILGLSWRPPPGVLSLWENKGETKKNLPLSVTDTPSRI